MHGDFSRLTFDPADGYRAVLLQQGRVLLDADLNEQGEITAHHDEVRTRDIVGRSGGPAPTTEEPGPFAVVGPSSSPATQWGFRDEQWSALRVTGGTYYVDGVLAESLDAPADGWPLGDQPFLPVITLDGDDDPGLPEPADDGRYLAYLDVWQRQVTFDEDASLLESALGGPDTTTRSQTVWQVRLSRVGADVACSDVHDRALRPSNPRRMAAKLAPPDTSADPCEISASGGYQRLENQLYRVQVHDEPDPASAVDGTFLWSRDNGSVVAGVGALDPDTAVLTLDRLGCDDELSFEAGQLVELTSRDRELRGLPGFLAATGPRTGFDLPVTWRGTPPASLAALGAVPIVRRWEGGPAPITTDLTDLEGGLQVRFPAGGQPRTGDYWQIPARTVRLAYGLTQVSGTIVWPPIGDDVEQPPAGIAHHVTPLAILVRTGGLWSTASDCRLLFPALTDLVSLDEVGGDGQEAMPGDPLPEPVRVAVRNGGQPVAGAPVQFTAGDGGTLAPPGADPASASVVTAADGVAEVRWRLNPSGPTTQTLTVRRLDDHDQPIDAPVVMTGRLSVARQVAWDPPKCERFRDTRTVQDALEGIIRRREIRFLGGDGQVVGAPGEVVQRPVRVVVDDGCGPVPGAAVTARAGNQITGPGRVKEAKEGELAPATLDLPGVGATATVQTGEDGVAAFWWKPAFGNLDWSTLDIVLDGAGSAPIRVTAHLGGSGRTAGVHITGLEFGNERPFGNDETIGLDDLASGIRVKLDGPVVASTVVGKPVVRVVLEMQWPGGDEIRIWNAVGALGVHTVELAAELDVARDGEVLRWTPVKEVGEWLRDPNRLVNLLPDLRQPMVGRFVVDGWAIVAQKDPRLHLNGHADAVVEAGSGRTLLRLPTDDEITGGQFVQWFRLARVAERRFATVPEVVGRTEAVARREIEALGLVVDTSPEPSEQRRGRVLRVDPAPGTGVLEGDTVAVVVSRGRAK